MNGPEAPLLPLAPPPLPPATSAERRDAARALVVAFHRGEGASTEEELDAAMGIAPRQPTSAIFEDADLVLRHPGESFADLPTPYAVARGLFEALSLGEDDLFCDLGCGHGRVVLYGALVAPARFWGIEIVEERAEAARVAAAELDLAKVTFSAGSVLDHDLSRGTVFYLSRPFGEVTEPKVMARLHDEARRRPFTIVTHRLPPGRIDPTVFEPLATGTLGIHRARG